MIETILLIAVVIGLIVSVLKRPKNYPPGPTLFPLAGLYPMIENDYPMQSWTKLHHKWGGVVGFVMGKNYAVLVNGWESVKEFLNHEDCQGRPDVCLIRDRFDGDNYGVVFTEGHYWRTQRRFTLHHFRNLGFGRQSHESLIEDEAMALVENIAKENGNPLTLLNRVAVSVINTTWSLMGGCRFSHESPSMTKLAKHIEESLHDIQVTGSIAVVLPFLRYLFPNATGYTSLKRGSKGVQEFTKSIIAEHMKTLDPEKPRDFIDIYLTELGKKKNIDPSFSVMQLEGMCMDLLSAGTDTTSNTISFAIMFLAIHQDIQELLHREMDEQIGKERMPTIRDRQNLVLTDATLMETLRMRCPLPIMIPHKVTKDTTVCGYDLPNETNLLVNVYSVHMDKEYWGDPENFRPQRFITPEGKLKKEERLIPFGKGKRSCLGETLARIMSFIFLASLVQAYKFTLAPGTKVEDTRGEYGFTLAPPNYRVIATPRV